MADGGRLVAGGHTRDRHGASIPETAETGLGSPILWPARPYFRKATGSCWWESESREAVERLSTAGLKLMEKEGDRIL